MKDNTPRRTWVAGAHETAQILALWNLAVAQPIYDLLNRQPEFLVVRGLRFGELLLFVGGLSLAMPLVLAVLPRLVRLFGAVPARVLQDLLVALLAGALVLNGVGRLTLSAAALVVGSLLTGGGIAWALRRWAAARSWVALLAISAVLLPLVFLWRLPTAAWDGGEGIAPLDVPAPENPVPVVFVVFDQLSSVALLAADGEIDATSFPNFAALAEQATWYPLATSVHPYTVRAIPALLTGGRPEAGQQPTLRDHPENLFTLLAPHFDIVAQESLTTLCPRRLCERSDESLTSRMRDLWADLRLVYLHAVLPESMTVSLPPVDQTWKDFGDARPWNAADIWEERQGVREERGADFHRFLGRIRPADAPSLYFYASLLPHLPLEYLPSGRLYTHDAMPVGVSRGGQWGGDAWAVLQDQQRYLLQVGFVDRLLGRLVERLRRVGLYDSALLVVTADHGIGFRPGGHGRGLKPESYAETLGVPLFVKLPGQRRGRRDERTAETIDVLPTILDTLGIPRDLGGRSLLGVDGSGDRQRTVKSPGRPGRRRRYSNDDFRRALDVAVRRKVEHFGSEGFSTRFYQIGSYGHLVGKRLSSLRPWVATSVETRLTQPVGGHQGPIDAEQFVPAHITGTSQPVDAERPSHFAIAVNGTVRAVSRTFQVSPRYRDGEWSAVVDETVFVPGVNRIEVFHVRSEGGELHLAPTASTTLSMTSPDRARGP